MGGGWLQQGSTQNRASLSGGPQSSSAETNPGVWKLEFKACGQMKPWSQLISYSLLNNSSAQKFLECTWYQSLHHSSGCWTLQRMKIVPCLCQPPCCDSLPHSWCTWKTPSSQNISHNSPRYGKKGRGRLERTTLGRKLWWISNTCPVTERIHKFNCCPRPKTLDFKLTSPLPCGYLFLTPMIAIPIFTQCLIGF